MSQWAIICGLCAKTRSVCSKTRPVLKMHLLFNQSSNSRAHFRLILVVQILINQQFYFNLVIWSIEIPVLIEYNNTVVTLTYLTFIIKITITFKMWSICKYLFFLSSLLLLVQGLHLHQATDSYILYLQGQQQGVKSKLDSFANRLQQNYKGVSEQNNINKKIQLLERYIKQQRFLLADINLQTSNHELNSSQWVCAQLSDASRKEISQNVVAIDQDLKDIDNLLTSSYTEQIARIKDAKQQTNGTEQQTQGTKQQTKGTKQQTKSTKQQSKSTKQQSKAIKQQIKYAEKTNSQLKNALNSDGLQIQPSSVHSDTKTNLNAPNWILDGKKVGDLNEQYKKAVENGALQICNIQQPFFSAELDKCLKCDKQTQFFSLRTSECVQCYNFDIKQHRCKDNQGAKTNFATVLNKIIIPEGRTIEQYKNEQSSSKLACPDSAPFFTGVQCIRCQTYFDIQTKQCRECQGKNHYDVKTHTCTMEQFYITNLDSGKSGLIIPNDRTLDDIAKGNKELQGQYKVILCPSSKPYYNDYECILCAEGTLFQMAQKSCGTCQSGTFFNRQTNNCEKKSYYTNLEDPNWSSIRTFPSITKDVNQKEKDPLYEKCPIQKPFSTGKQCIQCQNDEHFDYDKMQCAKCYNGQFFNKNLHNCTYTQNNYQTNPQKTQNLTFEGRAKNEWMYMYYRNIQQNEGMKDCPQQKPYFDGFSCIACPQEHPYFNLQYKMCQKCSEGTKYDKDHHQCLTTSGNIATQVPTLQKMAAGIFA